MPIIFNSVQLELRVCFIVMYKCCMFWYWDEEYIDLLIGLNALDVGAVVATDESRDDTISKIEKEEKAIYKSTEKSKNVANEYKEMDKFWITLVE